jgi:hypothetical protein
MISLADLRARNVVPTWQEAVAVVQELLHAVAAQGSADKLPDLSQVALIANGDVVALPGGTSTAHPVCHMAELLETLLDGAAAPPELEAFVKANRLYPPQFDTIDEFSLQLAFFERPGRRSDVEQLVGRAMTSLAQTRADEELRRLKEKASESADTTPDTGPARTPWYASRVVLLGAGVLLALVVVGSAVLWYGRGDAAKPATSTATAHGPETTASTAESTTPGTQAVGTASDDGAAPAQTGQGLIARTKSTLSRAVDYAFGSKDTSPPAAAPSTTPRGAETSARAKARPMQRRASSARHPEVRPVPEAPAKASEAPQVNTVVTAPPVTEPPMSMAASTDLRSMVYSAADAGVIPAILVRPLLPEFPPPDVPPDQIGTLELVVDEQGDVERVRLVSPSNRYHERMLVAHAKTWKFRPAIREGRPVKFRTVVRLTI